MTDDRRPIGYWLKRLDQLIEASFERVLAGDEVSRRQWQVLNLIRETPTTPDQVTEALKPFLTDDPNGGAVGTNEIVRRGWAKIDSDGRLTLTYQGRAAYQQLFEKVTATRQLMIRGIAPEEYAAVVDSLRRMATNLERAA